MKKNITLYEQILRSLLAGFLLYWGGFELNIFTITAIVLIPSSLTGSCSIYSFIHKSLIFKNEKFYLNQLPKLNPEPITIFSSKGEIIFENESSKTQLSTLKSFQDTFKKDIKKFIEQEETHSVIIEDSGDWYKIFARGVRKNAHILTYGFKISSLIKAQEELKLTHKTDFLTQIGNRNKLNNDLKNLQGSYQAIACMDIINFGEFNSFYGHDVGDEILINFANYLKEFSKKKSIIYDTYRLNGNTFSILLHAKPHEENLFKQNVQNELEKFLDGLKQRTFGNDMFQIMLDIRMGISINTLTNQTNNNPRNIIIKTETTLQEAKKRGVQILFYRDIAGIEASYSQNIIMSKKIKDILVHKTSNAKIIPFFQPILSTKDNTITKFESLARVIENGTIIPPFQFLEATRQLHLLPQLTTIILLEAAKKFTNTSNSFSINITTQDLSDNKLLEFFDKTCEKYNIDKSKVILEILEDENFYHHEKTIKSLFQKGYSIAIDDFGIGYSNFKKLQDIKAKFIKIDGSLIKNITTNKQDLEIVKSIALYAKSINAKTIAEFVSNEEIYNTLKTLDIDFMQGYYIGEPKPEPITTPFL